MDWKRKLTSRKFWIAVAGFVGLVIKSMGADETVATQVTEIIMAGACVIGYIIGEGLADAAGAAATDADEHYTGTEDGDD